MFFNKNDSLIIQHSDFSINFTFNEQLNSTNSVMKIEKNSGKLIFYSNQTSLLWSSDFSTTPQSFSNSLIVLINNKKTNPNTNISFNNSKLTIEWKLEYYIPFLFIMFLVGIVLLIIMPIYVIWRIKNDDFKSIFWGFAGIMFAIGFIIAYLWTP